MGNGIFSTAKTAKFASWDEAAAHWAHLVVASTPPIVVNGVEVAPDDLLYQAALLVRSAGPISASEQARRHFEMASMNSASPVSARKEWEHLRKVDSLATADIRLPASVAARPHKEDMINLDESFENQSPKIRRALSAIGALAPRQQDEHVSLSTVMLELAQGDGRHLDREFRQSIVDACSSGSDEMTAVCNAMFLHGVLGAYQSIADQESITLFASPELMGKWIARDRITVEGSVSALSPGDSILVTEAKSGTQKALEAKARELIKASVLAGENYRDAVTYAQIAARRGRLPDCAVTTPQISLLRVEIADQVELVSMERAGSWSASLSTSKDLVVTRRSAATASNCTDEAYMAAAVSVVGKSADSIIKRLQGEGIRSPEAAFLVMDEIAYKLAHLSSTDTSRSAQSSRDINFLSAFAGESVKAMVADVRTAVYSDRPFGSLAESILVTVTERHDKLEVREVGYSSGEGSSIEASTIWLPSRRYAPSDVAVEDLSAASAWRLSIDGICEETVSKQAAGPLAAAVMHFAARATERVVQAEDDIATTALRDGEYRLDIAASAALAYAARSNIDCVQFTPPDPSGKNQNAANLYAPSMFTFNRETGSLIGWCKSNRAVFSSRAVATEDLDRVLGQGVASTVRQLAAEDPNRASAVVPVTMSLAASAQVAASVADAVTGKLYVSTAVRASEALGLHAIRAADDASRSPISVQLGDVAASIRSLIGPVNKGQTASATMGM